MRNMSEDAFEWWQELRARNRLRFGKPAPNSQTSPSANPTAGSGRFLANLSIEITRCAMQFGIFVAEKVQRALRAQSRTVRKPDANDSHRQCPDRPRKSQDPKNTAKLSGGAREYRWIFRGGPAEFDHRRRRHIHNHRPPS